VSEIERWKAIEAAASRVLDAFSAYGNARAQQRCETAMLDLALAVNGDRYTITDKGRELLKGRE